MNEVDWSHPEFETIVRLLSARTGLAFRPDQRVGTEMGIQRAMKRSQVTDIPRFAELIQYDVQTLNDLIVELTVGETYFFREAKHFAQIRREVIPEIRQRRGHDHMLRIWCAGCASGEEAYSLAILCEQEGLGETSHILATDISQEALAKARAAAYRQWSLRGKDAELAKKYLQFKNDRYQLDEKIVGRVQFDFLNLALDLYPSFATGTKGLDLILCRNVLIYFDRETVRAVVRRLFDSLSAGGWLITASGDPPVNEYADFETVVTDNGVFYRRPLSAPGADFESAGSRVVEKPETPLAYEPIDKFQTDDEPCSSQELPSQQSVSMPALPNSTVASQLADARAALELGHYDRVLELTDEFVSKPEACALHLKALANIDTEKAVERCTEFVDHHSLSPDLHYLHAILLMELNLDVEALQAAQRAVFLDRSLAAAHLLLGSIFQRRGVLDSAQRHFRNARDLCAARPRSERVPLADGETAGALAATAELRLARVKAAMRNVT